jgi:signal transduction histidine kinase
MNTLLVIDDNIDNVKLLFDFLTEDGDFKVLFAQDGKDGIERALLAKPDLILLDVVMPGMDGFEICQILKSKEKTKHIPIIFMTVLTETVEKVKGFELGAADYIIKPFEQEELLARVITHVKLHQLQQQLAEQNQQLAEQNQQLVAEIKRREQVEASLAERTNELSTTNLKLTRALRLKDEFLANMSHELRTPLSAILGISEAFQDEVYGIINDKQHKCLNILEDSGRHLLALINDILDLSKIEADKLILNIHTVFVHHICQTSLGMMTEMAYKKQIQLAMIFDYAVKTIQTDGHRLTQILVNLLNNAIKFTKEGGSIQLEVKGDIENDVVQFSVQDTGIGIPQEEIEHIFEAFVQLDGALSRMYEGTGLGLSLVYRLTEILGGSLSVSSELGKGSLFTILLPWHCPEREDKSAPSETQPDEQETEPKSLAANANPPHSSRVILLAEDQETNLNFISDYLLTRLGYQIITARNGKEAIKQARTQHPDIILMDIQMPVMNGLIAIQKIRAETDIATIPIIALTALAMPGDRESCLEAGANEYLSKPVNMKKLVASIEEMIK